MEGVLKLLNLVTRVFSLAWGRQGKDPGNEVENYLDLASRAWLLTVCTQFSAGNKTNVGIRLNSNVLLHCKQLKKGFIQLL